MKRRDLLLATLALIVLWQIVAMLVEPTNSANSH